MFERRDIIRLGAVAAIAGACHSRLLAQSSVPSDKRQTYAVPHKFPPFELHAARPVLLALQDDIAGYAVERIGKGASLVWVRSHAGQTWAIGVDQRDLQFKFEVFTLVIETIEAMQERIAAWKPPHLPTDIPENFRKLMSTQPAAPKPPAEFKPWPFSSWRLDVLRRAEYIIENVDPGPTFGDNPNAQAPSKPGQVPPEASASCDVAVALLFTAANNKQLLIGVDWMPFDMVVTEDNHEIDEYISPCERVPLEDYASRLPASA